LGSEECQHVVPGENSSVHERWLHDLLIGLEDFRQERHGRTDHDPVDRDLRMLSDPSSLVLFWVGADAPDAVILGKLQPRTAHLHALYVREAARGNGIGRSLVNAFVDWATDQHRRVASVYADWENDDAIAFYESLGFRRVADGRTDRVMLVRDPS
jgi:GNAT superfamily N-acetyltransferase